MQRKPFTPTEAEAMASAIEAALRPVAQERKAHGQTAPGKPKGENACEDSAQALQPEPKSREVAAQAVGYSHDTISKVRKFKDLADDPETPDEVREAARCSLGEMDTTGSVAGPHHRVMRVLEAESG
ncbi:ParB-like nuclease [Segniliparus rotundus DSM 44985]|uniref:ParB-like nuclease n=1 Tax=Segniliparus rotundus (strain ATCC BAA-972 / CDC 1076 / CIP 108378 / DSM 44985 / JCM 13578) TaxID=640132 RepID=D6ZEX0_SEGRD|nr:chromosome partitioning protein ParB [Segniliparus rotundus]ADG97494.1 ParB-like nuclease [Segniliparus rotundus DSM 44985]